MWLRQERKPKRRRLRLRLRSKPWLAPKLRPKLSRVRLQLPIRLARRCLKNPSMRTFGVRAVRIITVVASGPRASRVRLARAIATGRAIAGR